MASKDFYRSYFAKCMPYVKFAAVLRDLGESKQNFSKFMKSDHYDHYLSIEKLERIRIHLEYVLESLT